MPFTTIYDSPTGTKIVGDGTSVPQVLHPTVNQYVDIIRQNGYVMSRTEIDAVNNMVQGFVVNGMWDKFKAIYPFIGGTANTNRFNLKDPRDSNAAFRLSFVGGWTHSSNGSQPNGTTGYADTFLIASTQLTLNDTHLAFYSRTATVTNNQRDIGAYVNGVLPCMAIGTNTGVIMSDQYNFNQRLSVSISSAQGLFHGNRNSSTSHQMFRNGKPVGIVTTANVSSFPTISFYVGAPNQTTAGLGSLSNKQYAFASIGASFTEAQAHAFYALVQRFQTTLGRQV